MDSWKNRLFSGVFDGELSALYGPDGAQRARYAGLIDDYVNLFGEEPALLCSSPGRTELCGNHTDHQRGRVLCGSVTRDILAAAGPTGDARIVLRSAGFGEVSLVLDDLGIREEEKGTSAALLRGVAAALRSRGLAVGGFRAVLTSDVPAGGGLSSSAAFEILAGALFSRLFNHGSVDAMTLAKAGQFAEREYFGKPSGLLDQAACACGGITMIDFADPEDPAVERIGFDYRAHGYVLCAVDTRTSHADLTGDYAAIPADMGAVARALGQPFLRYVNYADLDGLPGFSPAVLDRARHFFFENARVPHMAEALRREEMDRVLFLMNESGRSSRELLRNVVPASHPERTDMAVALDRAESLLAGKGAWRIHGGGFAGCIQCLVPAEEFESFRSAMDGWYGDGACFELRIRPCGVHFLGTGIPEAAHA